MNTPPPHDTASDDSDYASTNQQRLHELLPFHALGTLTGDDRDLVESWLAQHGAAHPEVQADIAWLRLSARQARELAHEPQAEAGLGELMARIATERPAPARASTTAPGWLQRLAEWWRLRPALGTALVAVVLVQAVVIGSLLQRDVAEQLPLAGGTATVAADAVVFSIAFKPGVSEAQMRTLLQAQGLQVVAGPSALGLWRVSVAKVRAEAALAGLQAAAGLVESVQREP